MDTDKSTLPTLLPRGYTAYERTHRLPEYVRRAVWALLACRTAALGGHVQACPEGHLERGWYDSCRHRMCPQGAWLQIERWLAWQQARLLACEYSHGLFTIPHALNELWVVDVAVMTQRLLARVHDTFWERLGDRQDVGARAGSMATLHTGSQTRILHPHIHCLVTGGGLNQAGEWGAVRNGDLRARRGAWRCSGASDARPCGRAWRPGC